MSLETPNRLAASICFSWGEADELPPGDDNAFFLDITAIQGVTALQLLEEGTLLSGFLLELQDKITPDVGAYMVNGFNPDTCERIGFTPLAQLTGTAAIDDAANEADGNFIVATPSITDAPMVGEIAITMWTIPPTDTVIPFNLPAPAPVI